MASDKTLYYFAFGSNMDPAQMKRRAPGARPVGRATLRGHRLVFRGVADIEAAADGAVHGVLWTVTADDLRKLDVYEGYPTMYSRSERAVQTEHRDVFSAIVYKMQPGHFEALPSTSYLNGIRQGAHRFGIPTKDVRDALARAALAQVRRSPAKPEKSRKRQRDKDRPTTVTGITEYTGQGSLSLSPFLDEDDEHDFEVFRRRLEEWRRDGITTKGRRLG